MVDAKISEFMGETWDFNPNQRSKGLLLHCGGHFFQILEGYRKQVEPLLARIKTGHRYEANVLQFGRSAGERSFPGWWMEFKKLAKTTL